MKREFIKQLFGLKHDGLAGESPGRSGFGLWEEEVTQSNRKVCSDDGGELSHPDTDLQTPHEERC